MHDKDEKQGKTKAEYFCIEHTEHTKKDVSLRTWKTERDRHKDVHNKKSTHLY